MTRAGAGADGARRARRAPAESFPRQYARTRRFSLGEPRTFAITADGSSVAFLRSRGGADPVNCLWALDIGSGEERLVVDPTAVGRRRRRR